MADAPLRSLRDHEVVDALLKDNPEARAAVLHSLAEPIQGVVRACLQAYRAIDALNTRYPGGDERFDNIRLFMHAAFNNVLSSTNLIVAGFPLPSGHLMRHTAECLAMALLIADAQSGVLERFLRERTKYPVQDAVALLRRPKRWRRVVAILGLADEGANLLVDLAKFYSGFSHSGAFALGYHFVFAVEGGLVLGAEFDPDKVDQIAIELRTRQTAFEEIEVLALRIGRLLAPPPSVGTSTISPLPIDH